MAKAKKIKSYEQLCEIKGMDPALSLPFPSPKTKEETAINAFTKIIRVIEYLNDGWVPDWSDWSQNKYYPWFRMSVGSGAGFSYHDYDCDTSSSHVGSRLVLKSRSLAEHIAKHFLNDYRAFMVIE